MVPRDLSVIGDEEKEADQDKAYILEMQAQ